MNFMRKNVAKVLGVTVLTCFQFVLEAQQAINWGPAGPIYTAGRIRNMIIDKNDPTNNTLLVGGSSSGLFISTNAGALWAPVNDQGSIRNISYLAQSADKTIYAATGEGFLRYGQKAKAQPGTGLYKLNGNNLVLVASSAITGTVINRVACSPTNANIIALATNKGILISQDGGANFSPAAGVSSTLDVAYGMDVKFSNNGILYCSVGNERGNHQPYTNVSGKVYKSSDASLSSFSNITPTSNVLADANYGRIEIATAPTNENVVYVSCSNKNNSLPNSTQAPSSASLNAIFVSYNGGTTWAILLQGSAQLDPLSNGGSIATGDYAHCLYVNPLNANELFIGGYSGRYYRRTGGTDALPIGQWNQLGISFAPNTQLYLHENIHDIKLIPTGNFGILFAITDAGIFRSVDGSSWQPFYKGLVTGQFNSVSIEKFPASANGGNAASGSSVTPYSGFIGGTGNNGLVYYSGTANNVTQESSYLGGEVYNAEYSKILNGAAYVTTGNGSLFRTANAKTSAPIIATNNQFSGALSKIAPTSVNFFNFGYTTGSPFKLWENMGNVTIPPDSAVFYNDSLRLQASMSGIPELTTKTTFSFSALRPNKFAIIDSVVIHTGTVSLPVNGIYANVPSAGWNTAAMKDITMKPTNAAVPSTTVNIITGTGAFTTVATHTQSIYTGTNLSITGAANTSSNAVNLVVLDATTFNDNITVTFSANPFSSFTVPSYPIGATGTNIIVSDAAAYYRVFATVFYKYKIGDVVSLIDNNISTKTFTYSTVLTQSLSWNYGSFPSYTLVANTNTAITSPTYVINPGGTSQLNPTFVVTPVQGVVSTFSLTQIGTYTLSATPVNYTLVAPTNTAISNSTFVITPGGTSQPGGTFVVTPTVATNYTITQIGTGTLTSSTFSSLGTPTYVLNPGNITQSLNVFVVSPTVTTTYSLQGVSSNTFLSANTNTTFIGLVANSTATAGLVGVQFAKKNPKIKIPMPFSARLAVGLNQTSLTDNSPNNYAIVVSKSPLNLNDPLNFIRVSQSGCYKDDANGNPTTSTISISGKPTIIEWSKSGQELYYATDNNELYRVSHIYSLMDLSQSSYSGKFFTDVFEYRSTISPNNTPNKVSPYRTTLLGSFGKPISSISVSNDDKNLVVTFSDPAPTGTNAIVMYNTNDARKSDHTNIAWVKKDGGSLANVITYCSLTEMKDSKKVFVGTDNGMFYTSDITAGSPNWVNVNTLADVGSKLPNVQVFDIKQQTINPWDCYNSGQIYVATNGRGVWTTSNFLNPYYVGLEDRPKTNLENNLNMYPNPTNGKVTVVFNSENSEKITLQVMDISGRVVKTESLGTLEAGEVEYSFETSELNSGIYIVNIDGSSNTRRIAKLIVTK